MFVGCVGPGERAPDGAPVLAIVERPAAVRDGGPPVNRCCTPGGPDACTDGAVQACVVAADSLCESVWDEACVAEAIVRCGAQCQ